MIIYEILTWLIILLGKIREKYLKKFCWKTGFYVRLDRGTEVNPKTTYEFKCCDCGLTHSVENYGSDFYPIRPKDYKYRLR
ncbi:hypothetical protein ES703_60651 [subsurface metagenome]